MFNESPISYSSKTFDSTLCSGSSLACLMTPSTSNTPPTSLPLLVNIGMPITTTSSLAQEQPIIVEVSQIVDTPPMSSDVPICSVNIDIVATQQTHRMTMCFEDGYLPPRCFYISWHPTTFVVSFAVQQPRTFVKAHRGPFLHGALTLSARSI